ncbi:unnamed protein product [Trichobilharzia regenti]|nr:unnamed protein product [Trichobilharzia regenti]
MYRLFIYPSEFEINDDLLFSSVKITESLSASGYDVTVLSIPYNPIYLRLYDTGPRDPLVDGSLNMRSGGGGGNGHSNYSTGYYYGERKNSLVGDQTMPGRLNAVYLDGLSHSRKSSPGKAAGPDGIPAEALKIDSETTADLMTPLLEKVWKEGKVPED